MVRSLVWQVPAAGGSDADDVAAHVANPLEVTAEVLARVVRRED